MRGFLQRFETLMEAVRREALEETAHHVEPLALLGCYSTHYPRRDITYLRFAYVCSVTGLDADRALDDGIVRAVWLTPQELAWIVAGGLAYTLGVPFYLWKSRPYAHAVWHLFVLAGVACHFVAVLSVMSPRAG